MKLSVDGAGARDGSGGGAGAGAGARTGAGPSSSSLESKRPFFMVQIGSGGVGVAAKPSDRVLIKLSHGIEKMILPLIILRSLVGLEFYAHTE